ncbi:P-loop containing nucleoside triphosphate hydrolase protein [Glonium stellatum]|uniref:P-loop containing nucleoside triphosphate hydrolase protein n=1 Tax=Glonium stellatum TaxID=574774 RepID=A0A8E2JRV3_9PEZI|nr:P-loop containing nucleoside triphosphate hydrolase protein [Glonium stellatum]
METEGKARKSPQPTAAALSSNSAREQNLPIPGPQDIVIAVMGITGSGKTTLINYFSDFPLAIGHDLESCTLRVDVWPCTLPSGLKIFLVDTPGFDDTRKTDTDILSDIADWLNVAYSNQLKLTGIIYLHRIQDVRITGSALTNLRMFKKLCGDDGLGSVVLATTMWDFAPDGRGADREKELMAKPDFWKYMIEKGSKVFRQDRGKESANHIIEYLMGKRKLVILDIQHEMVDDHLNLHETGAGQVVANNIEIQLRKDREEIAMLKEELEDTLAKDSEEARKEIEELKRKVDEKILKSEEEIRKLHVDKEQLRVQMEEQFAKEKKKLEKKLVEQEEKLKEEALNIKILKESQEKDLQIQMLTLKLQMNERWYQIMSSTQCVVS